MNLTSKRSILCLSMLLMAGLLVGGCSKPLLGPSDSSRSNVTIQGLTPEKLGKLGAALQQHPEKQQQLLEQNNLTVAEYEQAINTVSEEPVLARRYRQAFEAQLNQ